jgi:glycosyltransferase involved in cell wall biosynthesis
MRIVIDCRWIPQRTSGIGRHTRELVRALLDLESDETFVLLFDNDAALARERELLRLDEKHHVGTETVAYGPFSPRSTLALPRRLRSLGADVFHSTNFMLPLRRLPCAAVATIHDAAGRTTLRCLLVGEEDDRYPEVRRYVEAHGLDQHVRFTGYLDHADLVRAYKEADLLVHPSLYEGFGLPPLEAMACGTPVVSSNRTSLPEVLGGAAVLVEPEDPAELAAAIARVLDDTALRESLRAKGLKHVQAFTWHRAARETLQLYRSTHQARRQR